MSNKNLGPRPHYVVPDSVKVEIQEAPSFYKVQASGILFVPSEAEGVEDREGRCNIAHIIFGVWNLVHAAIFELSSRGVVLKSPLATDMRTTVSQRVFAGQPYEIQISAQVPLQVENSVVEGSLEAQISHPQNGLVAMVSTSGKALRPVE